MKWDAYSTKTTGSRDGDDSYIAVKNEMNHEKSRNQMQTGWEGKYSEKKKQRVPWKYGY